MEANAAAALPLSASRRLRRVDNGHILGTSALGVLHDATARGARGPLLASGAVRHLVVEFDVTVEFNTDLNFGDRECRDFLRGAAPKSGAA